MCVISSTQIQRGELQSSSIAFIENSLHVNPLNLPKPSFKDYKYIYIKRKCKRPFCSSSKNKESIYSQVSTWEGQFVCWNDTITTVMFTIVNDKTNPKWKKLKGLGNHQWPNEISRGCDENSTVQREEGKPSLPYQYTYIWILIHCWCPRPELQKPLHIKVFTLSCVEVITERVVEPNTPAV